MQNKFMRLRNIIFNIRTDYVEKLLQLHRFFICVQQVQLTDI